MSVELRAAAQRALGPAVVTTVLLVAALWVAPDRANLLLHAYVGVLGILCLGVVTELASAAFPSASQIRLERALAQRPAPSPGVAQLEDLERLVGAARWSSADRAPLRAVLRRIATQRLAARSEVEIAVDPEWPTTAELRHVLTRLESR